MHNYHFLNGILKTDDLVLHIVIYCDLFPMSLDVLLKQNKEISAWNANTNKLLKVSDWFIGTIGIHCTILSTSLNV